MGKVTAKANANIALVKYWGKQDVGLRLPMNSSAAIGLDKINTVTTVEFDEKYKDDEVEIDGDKFSDEEKERVVKHLDRVREMAGVSLKAKVVTQNNFPKGAGAASSASGFAALSVAAAEAVGLKLDQKEMSILARQGSGSASRSVPGGVCVWHTAEKSEESFAEPIEVPKEWDLRVLLAFVGDLKMKKVSTTEGMALTKETSPYYEVGVREAGNNLKRLRRALERGDWGGFGQVVEDECYRLHILCMTTQPNLLYWTGETVAIFQRMLELREEGVEGFFTVDAGPHVHVVCQTKDMGRIRKEIEGIGGVKRVVECKVGGPAEVIDEHLF